MFEASLASNIAGVTGETYRWDFGDGTPYSEAFTSSQASHTYNTCGVYTVRVEVTDSWGNVAISAYQASVDNCTTWNLFLPILAMDVTP